MYFALFKSLDNLDWYGDAPELPSESPDVTVEYLSIEDWELLEKDFVTPINDLCETSLWIGDYEFFDAKKCLIVEDWLKNRLESHCSERQSYLYKKLREMCQEARDLNTGVKIEF